MKVKITKVSSPNYWYADMIGEEFEVLDKLYENEDWTIYNIDDGFGYDIANQDCIIIID